MSISGMEQRQAEAYQADAYQLRLLGTFGLWQGRHLVPLPVSCQRLMAYLALSGVVSRSQAAGALWPDNTQERASSNLRTVLWRLRAHRVPAVLGGGQVIWLDEATSVDCWLFEQWARAVLSPEAGSGADRSLDLLTPPRAALAGLCSLVPDWDDEWLTEPREAMRMLAVHAIEVHAARLIKARQSPAAIAYLLRVCQLDPLRESAARLMIEAYLQQNNLTSAVVYYRRYRRQLRGAVGIEPSRELTSLVARYAPAALARTRADETRSVRLEPGHADGLHPRRRGDG
jgi:DNA-binding SARP family transcriptional activator